MAPSTRRPRRNRPEATEAQIQRAVMDHLALTLPYEAVAFHPANEGKRSARQGAELRRQGMLPGLPDVFVIWRGYSWAIELKSARGSLTAIQKVVHDRLRLAGCPVFVCRSIDEVDAALRGAGVNLRASILRASSGRVGERAA